MKTIGLLGGMSWESTTHYYRLLNQLINKQLGGLHSAQIAMISIDFHPLEQLMQKGDWATCGTILAEKARNIESAGADFLLICTNTLHKVAGTIEENIKIPLLHIADATAEKIKADAITTIGLLGTRFTMEEEFYAGRLAEKHGLKVIIPSLEEREIVHDVIFNELCRGSILEKSREAYLSIIDNMEKKGADAVIAGCTEITMLVDQNHTTVPLYDTTAIHAEQAVNFALAE